MAKATIGRLSAILSLNSAQFSKGMKSARKNVKGFRKNLGGLGKSLTSVTGLSIGAGLGIGLLVKQSVTRLNLLADTSKKLGIAAEELQGLRLSAEQTGVEVRTFDMGLQRMVRRIAEAAHGTGEAQGAIKELGLSAQSLARMSPDEQFMALSKAMQSVENSGDRVRLAMKLFDSEGVALVNTMGLGEAALKDNVKFVKELSGTYKAAAIGGIRETTRSLTRVRYAGQALVDNFLTQMGPSIEHIVSILGKMVAVLGMINPKLIAWGAVFAGAAYTLPKVAAGILAVSSALIKLAKSKAVAAALTGGPKSWAMILGGAAVAGIAVAGIDRALGKAGVPQADADSTNRDAARALGSISNQAALGPQTLGAF